MTLPAALTTFCRLDDLGLEVVGQQLHPDHFQAEVIKTISHGVPAGLPELSRLGRTPNQRAVVLSADNSTALLTVIPKSGPTDQATTDLVNAIRHREAALHRATSTNVAVTGTTAEHRRVPEDR